ncbi:hypothetical protein [Ornithinimicrobium cerasi]|uniref:Uncharacterized protein n=1 Tax=Ornithinimicrobium cerasi TaxID=2248773 RepID=A0A285VVY9_9MICO|nr:hypothetical protein [Ornithinimicrobium cerasi]SOC58219.1 hypothetical protein SAMN05421879_12517 [Ornithinimicrobium cerasi]
MPWTPPPPDVPPHDARLDPFRDRAGVLLTTDAVEVGRVFVAAETWWTREAGHLWWSRWSAPTEIVHGHLVLADGAGPATVTDWLSTGEELTEDLREWASGSFSYAGTAYRVVWLDEEESARVREVILEGTPDGPGRDRAG